MMKIQFDNLCTLVESKESKIRSLETIGFIYADYALCYILLAIDFSTKFTKFASFLGSFYASAQIRFSSRVHTTYAEYLVQKCCLFHQQSASLTRKSFL